MVLRHFWQGSVAHGRCEVYTLSPYDAAFTLAAVTTLLLLLLLQLGKAVLLEGSPGVGKTSLVAALARAAAARLVRINCSEHTDMIDLLGADLPAPGGAAGQFAW
jgi:midasin